MSAPNSAETPSQTENKPDARKSTPGTIETVAHLASSALRAAAYEGIQQPLNGLGQWVDHFGSTHLTEKLQVIAPAKQADFGSVEWHVDQIAAAAGQMLPYLTARVMVKPFFAEGKLLSKAGFLSKPSPLKFSMAEAAATGFTSQVLFHPVENKGDFWQEKLVDGSKSALNMSVLTATTHGIKFLSDTPLASKLKISSVLKSPLANGALSGIPAGLVGAEVDSMQKTGHLASSEEVLKSIYGMAMVGGTFGAIAARANRAFGIKANESTESSEKTEAPKISFEPPRNLRPEIQMGEQIPFAFDADFPIAHNNGLQPVQERMVPAPEIAAPQAEALAPTQLEIKFPEPLTPMGQRAFDLLKNVESLSREENAKVVEGKYPITLNEAQAIHVLLDEWVPGAQRLYNQIYARGRVAASMAWDVWTRSSLGKVKADMPNIYERALIKTHPDNDPLVRSKFVGQYFEKPLGIDTPEEVNVFLKAWERSGPRTRWLDSLGDIHCPSLLKLIRWGRVDEIPNEALSPIAEHIRIYEEPPTADTDVNALIAAAPGWRVSPLMPIDVASKVATMTPLQRLSADAAMDATRDLFNEGKESAKTLFSGENGEAAREAFFKQIDLISQLPVRAILKKTTWEDNLPVAVDVLFGDTISAEHKFALLQGLNSFHRGPQILATIDFPTFRDAYDKLIADNPVEKDYDAQRYFDWQSRNAIILATVFKKNWPVWLEAQQKAGRNNFEATNWLRAREPAEFQGLSQFLFQHGKKSVNHLERISDAWSEIKEKGKIADYKEALRIGLLSRYKVINDASFAEEASRWDVKPEKYEEYEKRFIASKDIHSPFPLDERWSVGGLTGRFIPRDDPRGLFLGEYTNCCQHPGGNADSSAWFGQENPKSGFFVVEDGDGEIIAQSWTVVTDNGGLIFDNVEAKGLEKRQDAVKEIYVQAAKSLSSQFHTVTMGSENSDLVLTGLSEANDRAQKMPVAFSGYTDTKNQVLLATNDSVASTPFEQPVFRGALNLDKPAMSDISKSRFPGDWQALPWEPATRGLVLDHRSDGVLGYALYEPSNRYVSDIAVKPGIHPKYGHSLTSQLFKQLRHIGGDWTADLRASTTYRMLQRAAQLKHVTIVSDTISDEPMGTEPMHHVVFNVDKIGAKTDEPKE